ncbi:hypothetical protein FJQ54_13050 [Sandaracinobacter neustonicus]|uniref:Uncharacterized protein n=1 Tax=Sandaracinobacter neustonicus TaxID=1715348 RepID=A0A501XFK8_9SPHN|nr:hypothetical protein [Sandaracinobacter neustonicus]TPE59418.1 hypothetical protein FJQ54_13050 [Sandaracinobacter neustonicus]
MKSSKIEMSDDTRNALNQIVITRFRDLNLTQLSAGRRIGWSKSQINELLSGEQKNNLTRDYSELLEGLGLNVRTCMIAAVAGYPRLAMTPAFQLTAEQILWIAATNDSNIIVSPEVEALQALCQSMQNLIIQQNNPAAWTDDEIQQIADNVIHAQRAKEIKEIFGLEAAS